MKTRSFFHLSAIVAVTTTCALTGISCAAPATNEATAPAAQSTPATVTTTTTSSSLPNLSEPPAKARFKVTDRVWPEKAGEAAIALWNDDKLAAYSITIDDNSAPDVEWWLEKSKEAGLPLTWFIITGRVGNGNEFWGDWALWNRVRAAGHAVESHTVTHLHTEEPGWPGIEGEYSKSIEQIEAGMPNHKVRFLAYPGGANSKLNDHKIAAKYYLAARGTRGSINMAGQIDYMNTGGMSAPHLDNPDPKFAFADVRNLLKSESRYFRGWAVLLYHLVKDKAEAQRFLDFYKTNEKDLWGATFGDVAMYGQERDTAHIKTEENTANRIALSLSDQMDDARFNYPLTIKVRLPENWNRVNATQNGKAIEARVVEYNGAKFALVKAVPDRGTIVLVP